MKINITEHDNCFSLDLNAETMAEAALLTRMGMNRTDEIRYFRTLVNKNGSFHTGIVFAKSKRSDNGVPKRS